MSSEPSPPRPSQHVEAVPPETQVPAPTPRPPGGSDECLRLEAGAQPIADYELIQLLGRGGFGEVWKARGPGGFLVALKFIRLGDQGGAIELRALEFIKDQRHPHLLGTFGAWQRQGMLIIAMELADGTLLERLRAAEQAGHCGIPREELLEAMREAAKGLDHLNSLGIQHRDIKPQNLLVVGGGVKVADFGLAKMLEHSIGSNSGAMTPAYAAPEFLNGETSNHSDQYALAVTYCQLSSGQLPFTGNAAQMMHGHLSRAPSLTMLAEADQPVVAQALAKNPQERWPSCRAFVEALVKAAEGSPAERGARAPVQADIPTSRPRDPHHTPDKQPARSDRGTGTPPSVAETRANTDPETIRPRRRLTAVAALVAALAAGGIAVLAGKQVMQKQQARPEERPEPVAVDQPLPAAEPIKPPQWFALAWPVVDPGDVVQVRFQFHDDRGDKSFSLRKDKGIWTVDGHGVDEDQVAETLDALTGLTPGAIPRPGIESDLPVLGLEPPMVTVDLWTRARKPRRLHVGRPVQGSSRRYARVVAEDKRSEVFIVSAADTAAIVRTAGDFALVPLKILLGDNPQGANSTASELSLRPNAPQEAFVFVQNPGDSPRTVAVEVNAEGNKADGIRSAAVEVPARTTKLIPMGPRDQGAPNAELPALTSDIQLRLLNTKGRELDRRLVRTSVREPRHYVQVTQPPSYEPALRRVTAKLKALRPTAGPKCRVKLVLPKDRIPGLHDRDWGKREADLPSGGEELTLTADILTFDPSRDDPNGDVYLAVDGCERAFVFTVMFADRGSPSQGKESRKLDVRLRLTQSAGQRGIRIEADHVPVDGTMELGIDPTNTGEFSQVQSFVGPRSQKVVLKVGGPNRGVLFQAIETDWVYLPDTRGISGKRNIRIQVFNKARQNVHDRIVSLTFSPPSEGEGGLEGTRWQFPGDNRTTVEFRKGGKALFSDSPVEAVWKQEGNKVSINANDYTLFLFTLEGDRMTGTWERLKSDKTKVGVKHPSSLMRIVSDEKPIQPKP